MSEENLKYAPTHEWASIEKQSDGSIVVTMGLTAFAMSLFSDLCYIDLPEVGDEVTAGQQCSEIESTKAVSEILSPATGTIIEVNDALADSFDPMINDPFGDGWIAKIQVSDESSLDALLDYEAYKQFCAEQNH